VSEPVILFEGVGKKFRRTVSSALLCAMEDLSRGVLRLKSREHLRRDEFWALREISFAAGRGECIGIIGPNGAGKSTLLKLVNRDLRPECGRVATRGRVTSLIRLGTGLRPMFTGRENIYLKCSELGLGKAETDGMLNAIVAFAGLEKSLDKPVKHYSDGMYARLEFSIATCVPADILLIDEVLAVGDVAFQMRCLERLEQLKRAGTTILFVSHAEMNVRQIADRCLLLFDGEALAFGEPEALFRKYYESVGFINRPLKPLGAAPEMPEDFAGAASILSIAVIGQEQAERPRAHTGHPLELRVRYRAANPLTGSLVLQFWSSAGLLLASCDSRLNASESPPMPPGGTLRVTFPFLPLAAGMFTVSGGFRADGHWLGYSSHLLNLVVSQDHPEEAHGLMVMPAAIIAET
jgi:lipopolysaccharide transport system ATP-binding protein